MIESWLRWIRNFWRWPAHAAALLFFVAVPLHAQERAADAPLPFLQKPLEPPKPGIRKRVFDKKFLAVTAVNIGASVAASFALNKCRHDHGIGPCTSGGYGEFKTREALRQGLTGFLVFTSWKLKQLEDEDGSKHKFWWLFQAANTGVNAGVIAQNASKHHWPARDRDGT